VNKVLMIEWSKNSPPKKIEHLFLNILESSVFLSNQSVVQQKMARLLLLQRILYILLLVTSIPFSDAISFVWPQKYMAQVSEIVVDSATSTEGLFGQGIIN
jgi:hypothetical protein